MWVGSMVSEVMMKNRLIINRGEKLIATPLSVENYLLTALSFLLTK